MINITEEKLKAALQIGLGSKGVYTDILENELIHHIKALAIPVVRDCSTCKHKSVSKYVEPCYGCRDDDKYDNYQSAIVP